ncbi:hypothetical protein DFH09DRAFT_1070199 [Mycena vulgaris]|nr:hypothetical protein DFH09DRAFT_1070199 [Mycena vulgaris]
MANMREKTYASLALGFRTSPNVFWEEVADVRDSLDGINETTVLQVEGGLPKNNVSVGSPPQDEERDEQTPSTDSSGQGWSRNSPSGLSDGSPTGERLGAPYTQVTTPEGELLTSAPVLDMGTCNDILGAINYLPDHNRAVECEENTARQRPTLTCPITDRIITRFSQLSFAEFDVF